MTTYEPLDRAQGAVRVIASLVSYFPDIDALESCLLGLVGAGLTVLVFDNTDCPQVSDSLRQFLAALDIECLASGENLGLGAAHNRVAHEAFSRGADYLLMLDQDTILSADAIATLVSSAERLRDMGVPFAAIGPRTSLPSKIVGPPMAVETIITSGSLVPIAAWLQVGALREDLFIDHVDHEWCFRARFFGLAVFEAPEVSIKHQLGSRSLRCWFLKRTIIVHPANRYYFRFRNLSVLTMEGALPFRFALCSGVKLVGTAAVAGWMQGQWLGILRFSLLGLRDAYFRRMGRPSWL